jgi:hypothetical protein
MQFAAILRALLAVRRSGKTFSHQQIQALYDSVLEALRQASESDEWLRKSASCVATWSDLISA